MKLWGQTNQKRWKKMVAEVMCLIMLIQMIPTPVHAEEWEEYAVSEEVQAVSADALAEDISLRTKDTKRFRMEDGSYTVVQYDGAVHYKDDEGNWENIDNRLQPFAMGDSMAIQGVEILEGYRNQENSISVYFASSLENGTIYEYGDDKYQVELSLFTDPIFSEIVIPENDSANGGTMESSSVNSVEENVESNSMIDQIQDNKIYSQARAKVLDTTEMTNAQFETKLEELYTLNNVKSSIIYEDVYDNVDLYYEVYGTSVKEKIIVKEPSDAYTYTFELQLNGLLPRLEKDGSISLYDPDLGEGTNAIQYQIPTPYMKDSSGIGGSPEVYYELGDMTEDGRVTLAIVADPQWINDEVREWPIMIDPAIIEYNENYTWDTYVIEGYPEAQNYASDSLYAGWSSYDNYGRMRIFWEYEPLPEIPPASVVVNCQILLRQFYDGYSYFAGSETMDLAVREITEDWNLDNVINWYRQPVYSNEIIDYKTVSTETMATRVGLDITSLAQEWYGGTKENNGVAIFPVTEYSTATASYTSCNASFASCNYGDMLPIFMVQYRDTKGIESYWTYHTQNVGEAGTGYINDFTGNLTFVHEDMDSVGNVMPIHGEHIYNGYLAGKNYTEDNTLTADFSAMKIGAGWKLGFQETMVTTTIGGISYYVHCDRDGTEHFYFNQDDDSEYESEDGLKYTVSKNANGTYTMKDESGGIKEFDADGRMTRMQDVNGNQKNFIYSNGQLTSVQEKTADGNAKTIMSYSYVNQYLSQMKDGLDQADTITYCYSTTPTGTLYSGSGLSNLGNTAYLRKIVHSKGNTTIFEYDENGFLTEVQDQNTMYKMTYEYNMVGSIPGKVIKTKEYGYDFENESALEGQSMGASYSGHKTTQFRTSGKDDIFGNNDDVIDTYVMDHFGRTVCQYTTLTGSQTIYAASNTMYSDGEDSFKTKHAVTQSAVGGGWASSGNVSSNNLLGNGDFANSSSWSLSNGASVTGGTLQVIGNHKGVRSSSQSITVNASGSQTYILSGWGKATAVAQNGEEGPQRFELRAVLTYTDGTNET